MVVASRFSFSAPALSFIPLTPQTVATTFHLPASTGCRCAPLLTILNFLFFFLLLLLISSGSPFSNFSLGRTRKHTHMHNSDLVYMLHGCVLTVHYPCGLVDDCCFKYHCLPCHALHRATLHPVPANGQNDTVVQIFTFKLLRFCLQPPGKTNQN